MKTGLNELIGSIIETFEDFLEVKEIVIENPEKEDDDFASNIYGTDYADLESRIRELFLGNMEN